MASYFKDHMRKSGLLTDEQHREVMNDSMSVRNGSYFRSLIKKGFLSEDTVLNEACTFFGYQRIADPFRTKIDFEATFKFRSSIDRVIEERQFAVTENGETVFILADPEQDSVKSAAITALGFEPRFAVITNEEFEIFLLHQLKPKQNEIVSGEVVTGQEKAVKDAEKRGKVLAEMETTATQKLLDYLLLGGIERRASDLHIFSMGAGLPAEVWLRVDGNMQFYTRINGKALPNLRNLLMQMCKVGGGERPDATVETQLNYKYKDGDIDTRIEIIKTVKGYDFIFRFIANHMKTLEELGMREQNMALLRQLGRRSTGLILFVGATGSGKTTTEYSMLREMHERNLKIHTIEDPVEITFPGITQVNLPKATANVDVEDLYEQKIAEALRCDIDVLVIGEVRSRKVARSVIQAADTGHLVLSTLHANDAYSAIARLYDFEVTPYSLGEVLSGIVAQKLVRRICPYCKEEYMLPENHKWRKMFQLGDRQIKLWRGCGCAACAGEGYLDRAVVSEILMVEDDVRDAIQTSAPRSVMMKAMKKNGFRSFLDDGVEKALAGLTTLDEVEAKIYNDLRGKDHFYFKENNALSTSMGSR